MATPFKLLDVFPNVVSIEITTRCPLKCVYCYRKEFVTHDQDMTAADLAQLKEWLGQMPGLQRMSFCGIGEALCHKDFYHIVGELDAYRISLTTSGTIPIDFDRLNANRNVDIVIFSVDATDPAIMELVCPGISYKNVISNVTHLTRHIQALQKQGVTLTPVLNCTIHQLNIAEIPKIMDFAAEYHFKAVHYSLPWGKEEFVHENRERLQHLFAQTLAQAKKYRVYMDDPFHSFCCIFLGHIMPYIDVKGNIYACGGGLNKGQKVGNVRQKSFGDIWQSSDYDTFKNGDLCRHCSLISFANM